MREKKANSNPNPKSKQQKNQFGCLLKKLLEIKTHDRKEFVSGNFSALKLIHLYIRALYFYCQFNEYAKKFFKDNHEVK